MKQPLLEDEVSIDSYPDGVLDFEEAAEHLASNLLEINYRSIISATMFKYNFVTNMYTIVQ